jgi:hypothetical protein
MAPRETINFFNNLTTFGFFFVGWARVRVRVRVTREKRESTVAFHI